MRTSVRTLRVMIASPLEPELAAAVGALDVVATLHYEPELLPVPRFPNDHAGTPRALSPAQTARFEALFAQSDAIFGYPGESPAGLVRALELGPQIAFVQGTSAGMGAQIKRANLPPERLERTAFATAAGVHKNMLAEFAFYGLLALRKDATRLARIREARGWDHFVMGELDGSTIAILGMGQIGGAIAERARAFGMHVIAVNRTGEPHPLADRTLPTSRLHEAALAADALAITLPMTDRTTGMVDAAVLDALGANGVVINVGRGSVVDQDAMIARLIDGRLSGAVLDVFMPEPLPPDNPLWTLPNVVFSPHTAAISVHENRRIVEIFQENLERFARGERLRNAVNLEEFY